MPGDAARRRLRRGRSAAAALAALAALAAALALLLLLAVPGPVRGQSAPGGSPATAPAAEADDSESSLRYDTGPIGSLPDCGLVSVTSTRCVFQRINRSNVRVTLQSPVTTVVDPVSNDVTVLGSTGNGQPLPELLRATFPYRQSNPNHYRTPVPEATFVVTKSGATTTGTARIVKNRQTSVIYRSNQPRRYQVQLQRLGRTNDDMSNFPTGRCSMFFRAPCSHGCPEREADFGAGCVAATATADVCPADEAKFGDSPTCAAATPTADVCPEGEADFGDGCVAATDSADVCPVGEALFGLSTTCIAATPADYACPVGEADFGSGCVPATATVDMCPSGEANFTAIDAGCIDATCAIQCTLSDTQCSAGYICPDGTEVAAECADRRADTIRSTFDENPCVCTALLELARLSTTLRTQAPWNNLRFHQYCQAGRLQVYCETVDGVKVPTRILGNNGAGLAGALPASLGLLDSLTPFNWAQTTSRPCQSRLGRSRA